MGAGDFVPRIVSNLASEAGIKIITRARGDVTRLARARARRRWRTAFLGLVRAAMLVSPLLIVSMQGVAGSIPQWLPTEQATERPVGITLQRNATEVVVDVFGALTPDVLKPWIGAQVTGVSQAPVATGT